MEKYIEILDSLMKAKKEKKKKEPTIKEKEAFRSAWLSLVADAGLTGSAEQFLYEGFAFCGAEPFYAYLIQTEDQNATLAAMFSGKYYGIDSNVSFRLVAHWVTGLRVFSATMRTNLSMSLLLWQNILPCSRMQRMNLHVCGGLHLFQRNTGKHETGMRLQIC